MFSFAEMMLCPLGHKYKKEQYKCRHKNKLCESKATLTSSLFTIMNEVNNKVLQNIEIFDFVLFCEVLITYYFPKIDKAFQGIVKSE